MQKRHYVALAAGVVLMLYGLYAWGQNVVFTPPVPVTLSFLGTNFVSTDGGTVNGDLTVGGTLYVDGGTTLAGGGTLGPADVSITGQLGADLTAKTGLAGGFDLSVATAAAATVGSTLDVTGAAGGTAAVDSDGKAGGVVTITGGAGSAKNGAGANDGSGADVVLNGGTRGGANGTAVQGIVRVGDPSVQSTKETRLLAVEGALEVDGNIRVDGSFSFGGAGGGNCAGVAADAFTCHGQSGFLNDTTDIALSTTRTAITWTNASIATTSVVNMTMCSAPDAAAFVVASVVPGAGTATVYLRNVGLGNQTSDIKMCWSFIK